METRGSNQTEKGKTNKEIVFNHLTMANTTLTILLGVMLVGSLALVIAAEKDSSWLKSLLNSDELAELESKEGNGDEAAPVEK